MDLDSDLVCEKIKEYKEEDNRSCSQATLMGICEAAGFDSDKLSILASGFSGGIGRTFDEGSCGALTGGIIALGLLVDNEAIVKVMSNDLFNSFKNQFSSVTCGNLSNDGKDLSSCLDYCLFIGRMVCELLKTY